MSTRYGNGPQQGNGFCGYIVGQHVVLVDDIGQCKTDIEWLYRDQGRAPPTWPVRGVVYTVRMVEPSISGSVILLRLVEIKNDCVKIRNRQRELGFPAPWFRPLQKLTPETFMSTDAPVKQGEPA